MDELLFKTRKVTSNFTTLILAGITLGICPYYAIKTQLANNIDFIIILIFNSTIGALSLLCFYKAFLSCNIYEVYNDRIRTVNFFNQERRSVNLREFKSWTEFGLFTKRGTNYILRLYTDNKKISFQSQYLGYKDYNTLKNLVTKGIPEDRLLELKFRIKLETGLIKMYLGILIFFEVMMFFSRKNYTDFDIAIIVFVLFLCGGAIINSLNNRSIKRKELRDLKRTNL